MAFVLDTMVAEKSTTTGNGAYTLGGVPDAIYGWRTFLQQIGNGNTTYYRAEMGAQWEEGLGTVGGGGSTLTRTAVRRTHAGTTSTPLSWGAGTKTIQCILPGGLSAVLAQENEWAAHQRLNGYRVYLDIDRDTYLLASSDDVLDLYVAGTLTARFTDTAFEIVSTDSGAGSGPTGALYRNSVSAAASDFLGGQYFYGNTDLLTKVTYARVIASIESPTNASYAGKMGLAVPVAGSLVTHVNIASNFVQLPTGIDLLAGKTANATNTVGAEVRATGLVVATVDGAQCIIANRKSNDGTIIALQQDGTTEGAISISGTTAAYGTFLGFHWGQWRERMVPEQPPPIGAVLCMCEERCGWWEPVYEDHERIVVEYLPKLVRAMVDGEETFVPDPSGEVQAVERRVVESLEVRREYREDPKLPRVRLSECQGETAVYGVYGGVDEDGDIIVWALGTAPAVLVRGPVQIGQPLWTSDAPGVAEAMPADAPWWTCIGRASKTDAGEGVRPVPFLAKAG